YAPNPGIGFEGGPVALTETGGRAEAQKDRLEAGQRREGRERLFTSHFLVVERRRADLAEREGFVQIASVITMLDRPAAVRHPRTGLEILAVERHRLPAPVVRRAAEIAQADGIERRISGAVGLAVMEGLNLRLRV